MPPPPNAAAAPIRIARDAPPPNAQAAYRAACARTYAKTPAEADVFALYRAYPQTRPRTDGRPAGMGTASHEPSPSHNERYGDRPR